MPRVLITGANRGLGLEYVRQYAKAGWQVIACSRSASPALADISGTIDRHTLEVTDPAAVRSLAAGLSGTPIDVLIANAGISGSAAGTLDAIDRAVWQQTFLVNTLAPLEMAAAFKEHVAASTQKKMIAISSRLGSIDLNVEGGRYAYRASKAALNMHWRSLASDLRSQGTICAVLHPGWVRTDMGGAAAPVSPPESVAGMIKVIGSLRPQDSGRFFNYDGAALAW